MANISKKLPPDLDWTSLVFPIGRANAGLARYDGLLQSMVNPGILLSPLTLQEAVLSSRIEGTEATIEEVLQHEAGARFEERKELDIQEIINYREALTFAEKRLEERPLSLNLIKEVHAILLDSVRGHNRGRGEFRRIQNWIGPLGCTIEQATYVPPDPSQLMEYLDAWEKYIHAEEKDLLVQVAIMHAQFEVIHPFLDGNGRIGRILVPVFLYEKKMLVRPLFHLSAYLERHRSEYYTRLRAVTAERDWNGWIKFFLEAVISQAKENTEKARDIQVLYKTMKDEVPRITGSKYTISILDALFEKPIFSTTAFIKSTGIPKRSALRAIRSLKEADILSTLEPGTGRRPEILVFSRLLDAAEGKEVV
jgi:Fic family protein